MGTRVCSSGVCYTTHTPEQLEKTTHSKCTLQPVNTPSEPLHGVTGLRRVAYWGSPCAYGPADEASDAVATLVWPERRHCRGAMMQLLMCLSVYVNQPLYIFRFLDKKSLKIKTEQNWMANGKHTRRNGCVYRECH